MQVVWAWCVRCRGARPVRAPLVAKRGVLSALSEKQVLPLPPHLARHQGQDDNFSVLSWFYSAGSPAIRSSDAGVKFALGEAGADELALGYLVGVAEEVVVRTVDQGVAAVQDAQGAQGMEAGEAAVQPEVLGAGAALRGGEQAGTKAVEALAGAGELQGEILTGEAV